MIDKLIIGISGFKQSGKDTVAGFIKPILEQHRKVFTYHIGDTIIQTLADMTGGDVEKIRALKNDPYMRGILQHMGAERRRIEGNDCFINEAQSLINKTVIKCYVLIPSVRFINEYQWIKDNNGLVIRVFRPEADNIIDTHITESEIRSLPFDFSILNDANIGRAEFYCKNLAQEIIKYGDRK